MVSILYCFLSQSDTTLFIYAYFTGYFLISVLVQYYSLSTSTIKNYNSKDSNSDSQDSKDSISDSKDSKKTPI